MLHNRVISSFGSTRRIANMWVDLGHTRRRELLGTLDTDTRIAVIEHMVRIRNRRRQASFKKDSTS